MGLTEQTVLMVLTVLTVLKELMVWMEVMEPTVKMDQMVTTEFIWILLSQ
jgi:hypothetical protein